MKSRTSLARPRHLQIEWVPLASLKRNPRNTRQHSVRQIRLLVQSITAFGFNVPVIVDAEGVVICGHARLIAADELGLSEVPVLRLASLRAEQAAAFAIADNRLTEIATWDKALLAEVLGGLAAIDLDFNLEATGFTMGEIDLMVEGLEQNVAEPDLLDEPVEAGSAVTKAGNLWLLGKHRVLCGNALEAAAFTRLMEGNKAAAVFTDPPYNVRVDGHASGKGKVHHREFAMAAGEMSEAAFTTFLTTALQHLADNSADGSLHYVCIDWRHLGEVLAAGKKAYSNLKNICAWIKDTPGMGSLYRSQHELICVFKKGKSAHRNNVQLGAFGRNRTNVWAYPSARSLSQSGDENLLALHPTVKPTALVADAILDCTARGDIVLDAFLGSGSTLLAAERVGRTCFGIELDPLYVDTAIRRWQTYSGERAVLAATGEAFEAMAQEAAESDGQ